MAEETEVLTRRATFSPSSLNREKRTVRVTVSTGAAVNRRGYVEKLTLPEPQSIIGLPVLNSHRQDSLDHLVGRVIGSGRDAEGLWADIQISERAEWLLDEIEAGIITSASIGYSIARSVKSTDPVTGQAVHTVEPAISEISFVPVPADKGANVRSLTMPEDLIDNPAAPTAAENRAAIRTIARSAGMTTEQADDMLDRGLTITEARAEAFEAMQARARQTTRIRVISSHDDPANVVRRQTDYLVTRMAGGTPADDVRAYMGMSMLDLARDALTRSGVSVRGLSADEVLTRAHTESDFPLTVSNAMGKVAAQSYQAAQSPLKTLGRQRTLSNFKASTSIRLGELGRLEPLSESGEFTHTSRAENGESITLATYGRALNVTRKLVIDDDLGLLGDMTAAFGEAAAATEADIMVGLLTSNPNLSDGVAVFASGRGNLAASGTAISVASVDLARKAMRGVTGLDGKTLVNVQPRYLLVGPEIETDAEAFLASINATTTADVNPFSGKLTLMVEPRLTGDDWFVFADPARLPCLQYGYLSSAQGVQIQRAEAWDTLGFKYRAWLDFGAGWLDWRGAYKNPGA